VAKAEKIAKELEAMRKRASGMREKMNEAAANGLDVTITVTAAFLGAGAMKKYAKKDEKTGELKEPAIFGLPADGVAGLIGVGVEIFDVGGSSARHIGAAGLGLLCSAASHKARSMVEASSPKVSGNPTLPMGANGNFLPTGAVGAQYGVNDLAAFLANGTRG
jgi:hypothetical protein